MTESGRPALEGPFFLAYKEPGLEEEFQVFNDYGPALSYMEKPEVEEGSYRLFDSAGREARLGTQKWDVIAKGWSQPRPDVLRSGLSAFLRRKGHQPPNEDPDVRAFAAKVASIMEELEDQDRLPWIRAMRRAMDRLRRKGT